MVLFFYCLSLPKEIKISSLSLFSQQTPLSLSLSLSLSMLLNLLGLSISPYLDGLCPITSSLSLSMLLNLLGLSISPYLDGLCPITSSYTLGGYLVIFCPPKCRLVVVVVVIIGGLAILKIWVDKFGYVIFWIWVCDCDFIMGIM